MIEKNEETTADKFKFKDVFGVLKYLLENPGVNRVKKFSWANKYFVTLNNKGQIVDELGGLFSHNEFNAGEWVSAKSRAPRITLKTDRDILQAIIAGRRVHLMDAKGRNRAYFLQGAELLVDGERVCCAKTLPTLAQMPKGSFPYYDM